MVFEWQTNITYGYLLSKLLNQALFFQKKIQFPKQNNTMNLELEIIISQ
jgi:hypothetical protein